MRSYSSDITRRSFIALGGLALAGCTAAPAALPVASAAALPSGASRIAVDIHIEIISAFSDVTQQTDRAELAEYVNAAMAALSQKLAAENLELVSAPAVAPLRMRLDFQVRKREPIVGGRASAKAVLTNEAGQELLTATGSDGPYMLMHIRDTTIALRKSSEQVGDEIVARLKALKTS